MGHAFRLNRFEYRRIKCNQAVKSPVAFDAPGCGAQAPSAAKDANASPKTANLIFFIIALPTHFVFLILPYIRHGSLSPSGERIVKTLQINQESPFPPPWIVGPVRRCGSETSQTVK